MRATNWIAGGRARFGRQRRIREEVVAYSTPASLTSEQSGYDVRLTLWHPEGREQVICYLSITEAEALAAKLVASINEQREHVVQRDNLRRRLGASN